MSHAPALWPHAPAALAAALQAIDAEHDLGGDVLPDLEQLIAHHSRAEPLLLRAQVQFNEEASPQQALQDLQLARTREGAAHYIEWMDCLTALCDESVPDHAARALAAGAKAIARRPDHFYSWRCMGAACSAADDVNGAIEHNLRAAAIWPRSFRAHNRLQSLMEPVGRLQELAEQMRGRDIPLHRWGIAIEYNIGTSLYEAEQYQEAIGFLDVARERMGPVNNVQHNRGLCLEELSRYQDAIDEWTTLIAREPNWDWPRQGRGRCAALSGQFDLAASDLKHLQRISPDDAGTGSLAILLPFEQQQYEAALQALEAHEKKQGVLRSEYLLNLRGVCLKELGRHAEAEKDFLKAIEASPSSYRAHRNLINNSLRDTPPLRADARKALPYAQAALALRPNLWEALELYLQIQITLGDDAEVSRSFESWIQRYPNDDHGMVTLGTLLMDRGRHPQALIWFEAAQRIDPTHPYAMWGQGVCLGEMGRTDQARQMLQAAMQRYQINGNSASVQSCQRSLDALNRPKGWLNRLLRR